MLVLVGVLHEVPKGSRCHQDKHQAPTLPHLRPLSLQDPIRSSTFIRKGIAPARIESRHLFILELIANIYFTVDFIPWMLILYY